MILYALTQKGLLKKYRKLNNAGPPETEHYRHWVLVLALVCYFIGSGLKDTFWGILMFLSIPLALYWRTCPERGTPTQLLARRNKRLLYGLIFSGKAKESELEGLIFMGASHFSPYNGDWYKFVAKVKERRAELPESVQAKLDRHERLHGW